MSKNADKPLATCACGAVVEDYDETAFCIACGAPWQARNRVERELDDNFAAITDIGLQHRSNEDDVRLATVFSNGISYKILVVCDGLSSAQRSREASAHGAETACTSLSKAVTAGLKGMEQAMVTAIMAAHDAVCSIDYIKNDVKDPPGTTIVAALFGQGNATIGWVGDSRAYVASAAGVKLLTHDHSWVNQVVDDGILTEAEAAGSIHAHVITHCLGPIETAIEGSVLKPSVMSTTINPNEVLILCSDGLWNYAEKVEEFADILGFDIKNDNALTLAKRLVAFALSRGGRDNITVAVAAENLW